jgi:hypothetical protein
MKLENVNKPTRPFWNKVQLAAASAGTFCAGFGLLYEDHNFIMAGGLLGVVGTVLPIFANK